MTLARYVEQIYLWLAFSPPVGGGPRTSQALSTWNQWVEENAAAYEAAIES